ncbi:hypothetical protein PFISCL1PPCAC_17634, partial [Pristionchus fissidentatus]
ADRSAVRVLLRLLARLVLVVGVLLHVHHSQSLGLGNKRRLLVLWQLAPPLTQPLAYLRVVHVGLVLADLAALQLRPYHKGVHRALDVRRRLLAVGRVAVGSGGEGGDLERAEGHASGQSNCHPSARDRVLLHMQLLLLLLHLLHIASLLQLCGLQLLQLRLELDRHTVLVRHRSTIDRYRSSLQ